MIGIHIEQTHAVLRGGPNFQKFGDEYTFACTLIFRNDTVEVIGLAGEFSVQAYREIKKKLKELGYTYAIWERKRSDSVKQIKIEL